MNLGVVLLPLRVFLGFISIYAGMGKLCDPVYFDGGERGSMVTWLQTLQPWALAEPLRDFALAHPVGAGLSVAFLQVIVGVLTVFGLWQRFAACFGALLSAALLMTVSWKTVPAYDAPDIIYLAAWSPLIIAGAPSTPWTAASRARPGARSARGPRSGGCAAGSCAAEPSWPASSAGSPCSSARSSAAPSAPPPWSPCPDRARPRATTFPGGPCRAPRSSSSP